MIINYQVIIQAGGTGGNDTQRKTKQANVASLSVDKLLRPPRVGCSCRRRSAGPTNLLFTVTIIDITPSSVAMTTVLETFNFLSSIIIIYETICCAK